MAQHGADGVVDLSFKVGLAQKAERPDLQGTEHQLILAGEKKNGRCGLLRSEQLSQRDAVESWHIDVQKNNVKDGTLPEYSCKLQRVSVIGERSVDILAGKCVEDPYVENLPGFRFVVTICNAQFHADPLRASIIPYVKFGRNRKRARRGVRQAQRMRCVTECRWWR